MYLPIKFAMFRERCRRNAAAAALLRKLPWSDEVAELRRLVRIEHWKLVREAKTLFPYVGHPTPQRIVKRVGKTAR